MEVVSRSKRRLKLAEEEGDIDYFSRLPNNILEDIISLLPTKDAARTQVLSSRWCQIWRSAPLNLDLNPDHGSAPLVKYIPAKAILNILSTHQGPIRRLSIPEFYLNYKDNPTLTVDRWLQYPTLDTLQELEFQHDYHCGWITPLPLLPIAVHHFTSTLRVASFGGCSFLDGNSAIGLHFPLLKKLSLSNVNISESSLHSLLDACPILESLLLTDNMGCSHVQIVSPTLRSIGVDPGFLDFEFPQLIIKDAPCLERLLHFNFRGKNISISVISAPKLHVLGTISTNGGFSIKFFTTLFQGSHSVSLMKVVHTVKVLALTQKHLSLDTVIEFLKRFPCLEKLYIQTEMAGEHNSWYQKHRNFIGTCEIRLKKIVLTNYHGNTSHVNFAKFFVLNARMLESMRLESYSGNPSNAWIDKQHKLLKLKNKASRDLHLDLVSNYHRLTWHYRFVFAEQVHDLSTSNPFQRFHD